MGIVIGACLIALGPTSTALAATSRAGAPLAATDPVVSHPVGADDRSCADGAAQARLNTTMRGGQASVTVVAAGCTSEILFHVSSYTLDQSADNTSTAFGRSNPFSFPQHVFAHGDDIRIPAGYVTVGQSWSATVALPPCGDYQEDLYQGAVMDVVEVDGHPGFRAGGIVLQDECAPTPTHTPSPTTPAPLTPAPTVPATTSPAPTTPVATSTPSSSPTSSSPTSSSPASPTSSPSSTSPTTTPSTTSPTTTPSTTATSGSTTPAPTSTTAAPVPTTTVTPAPATTAVAMPVNAPVRTAGAPLAYTGAGGVTTLVGLAAVLMALGTGALVITRRSRLGTTTSND